MALKLQKMHSMNLAKLEIIVCKQSAKWQHLSHKKLVHSQQSKEIKQTRQPIPMTGSDLIDIILKID